MIKKVKEDNKTKKINKKDQENKTEKVNKWLSPVE